MAFAGTIHTRYESDMSVVKLAWYNGIPRHKERIPQMATKAQDEKNANSSAERSLAVQSGEITELIEWATDGVNSLDELERLFGDQGVTYSAGEELTGDFQLVTGDKKQVFCQRIAGVPLAVIKWRFQDGDTGEYVTMHLFIEGHGKFILNDGAKTGLYGQLRRLTDVREQNGVTPTNGGLIVRTGIKQNKPYEYDKRTGKAVKRGEDVPAEHRAWANPTYRFDL
jgi:hypothetical protein